jgi:hypothetical protein
LLIYGGLKPAPRWSRVVALTTSSANGSGEDVHGESAPVFGMAMCSNDMPWLSTLGGQDHMAPAVSRK